MKALRLATILIVAGFVLAGLPAQSRAAKLTVPKGVDVPLAFDQSLTSKTAKVGDQVKFHVTEAVVVDSKTIIKEGTPVTGMITKVDKRKHFGVNAKMQI